jgi:hypothetical protein
MRPAGLFFSLGRSDVLPGSSAWAPLWPHRRAAGNGLVLLSAVAARFQRAG